MHMKYFLVLLLIVVAAASTLFFNRDTQRDNRPVTGLPWQIDILPGGDTQVFGITPGRTTFGEAIKRLGDDMELAIIAAPHETGTLEAYYSHHSFGPITGKVILVLDIAPDELSALRERALQDRGTRRYYLARDDLPAAYRAPVRVITFMPSINLDEEIVQARFGTPAGIIQDRAGQEHLLYPDKGLDLILSTDGKDVLQYLSPGAFSAHRARLQE
jgi:hypothetical protein